MYQVELWLCFLESSGILSIFHHGCILRVLFLKTPWIPMTKAQPISHNLKSEEEWPLKAFHTYLTTKCEIQLARSYSWSLLRMYIWKIYSYKKSGRGVQVDSAPRSATQSCVVWTKFSTSLSEPNSFSNTNLGLKAKFVSFKSCFEPAWDKFA